MGVTGGGEVFDNTTTRNVVDSYSHGEGWGGQAAELHTVPDWSACMQVLCSSTKATRWTRRQGAVVDRISLSSMPAPTPR